MKKFLFNSQMGIIMGKNGRELLHPIKAIFKKEFGCYVIIGSNKSGLQYLNNIENSPYWQEI